MSLKRARRFLARIAEEAEDIVTSPAVRRSTEAARLVAPLLAPGAAGAGMQAAELARRYTRAGGGARGAVEAGIDLLNAPADLTYAARAPIVYTLARRAGFTPEGGPLGARVEEESAREARARGGAGGLAARAGLTAFREATDFTNYTPLVGFKGIAAARFLKSVALGAGMETGAFLGGEVARRAGAEPGGVAETASELLGALAGGPLAVAGVSRAIDAMPGAAARREVTRPPIAIERELEPPDARIRTDVSSRAAPTLPSSSVPTSTSALPSEAASGITEAAPSVANRWLLPDTPRQRVRDALLRAPLGPEIANGTARFAPYMTPDLIEEARRARLPVELPDERAIAEARARGATVFFHGTNGPLRNGAPEPGMALTSDLESAATIAKTISLARGGRPRVFAFLSTDPRAIEPWPDSAFDQALDTRPWRVVDERALRRVGAPIDREDASAGERLVAAARAGDSGTATIQGALTVAGAIGGAYLGWESGEDPESRVKRAALGALVGAGAVATPGVLRSRVAREIISPHLNYGTTVRGVWQSYHKVYEAAPGFAADIANIADEEIVPALRAGATLDPAFVRRFQDDLARQIATATDEATRAKARAAADRLAEMLRERPEFLMIEHPAQIQFAPGPAGQRAREMLAEYYRLMEEQLIREQDAGVWDAVTKTLTKRRDQTQTRLSMLEKQIARAQKEMETWQAKARAPFERIARQWDALATEQRERANALRAAHPGVEVERPGGRATVVPVLRPRDLTILNKIDAEIAALGGAPGSLPHGWPATSDRALAAARERLDRIALAASKLLVGGASERVEATRRAAAIMERVAERAERAAALTRAHGDRLVSPRARALAHAIERRERAAERLRQSMATLNQRITHPVSFYIPHIYARPLAGARVVPAAGNAPHVVGGRRWWHHDRAYPTYLQALLNGEDLARQQNGQIATLGDLLQIRITSGERARAQAQIIRSLIDALRAKDGTIVPSWAIDSPEAARKAGLVPLKDVRLIIPDKQAAQAYLQAMRDASRSYLTGLMGRRLRGAQAAINSGDMSFYVTRDWASFLDAEFSEARRGTVGTGVFGTAEAIKELRVIGDIFFGANKLFQGITAAVALVDPFAGRRMLTAPGIMMEGVGRALRAAFQPVYADAFLRSPVAARWRPYLNLVRTADRAALSEGFEQAPGLLERASLRLAVRVRESRAPDALKGPLAKSLDHAFALERAQFDRLMPVLKTHAAEAIYQFTRRVRPNANDEAMREAIGRYVDLAFGGAARWRWGLSQNRDQFERFFLFTNKYWRGRFETMLLDPARNIHMRSLDDPEVAGLFARRFWGAALLFFSGATITTTLGALWAAGLLSARPEPGKISALEFLDPRHPESPLNPDGRNFGVLVLPAVTANGREIVRAGTRINVFGDMRTVIRLLARPADLGATRAHERKAVEDGWDAMLRAAVMGFTQGAFDASLAYARDRLHIPITTAIEAIENHDYRGRAIRTEDTAFEQVLQVLAYGSRQAIPSTVEPLLVGSASRPGYRVPGFAPGARGLPGAVESAATFLGFPLLPGNEDPRIIQETVREFLHTQKIPAGINPVQTLQREMARRTFDTIDQQRGLNAFRDAHPEVFAYLDARRIERHIVPAVTRESIGRYHAEVAFYRQRRDEALRELDEAYRGGELYGNALRARREEIHDRYASQVEGAAARLLGAADADEAARRISAFQGRSLDPRTRLEAAEDRYYSIRPDGPSREAMEVFLVRRRQFWDELRKSDPDLYEALRQRLVAGRPSVEREYQLALDDMAEYQKISPYLHVRDPDEARRLNHAIARARDRVVYGLAPDVSTALLTDSTLDTHERARALLALGGRYANPRRAAFRRAHPRMAVFFSDLLADEIMETLERADLSSVFSTSPAATSPVPAPAPASPPTRANTR